MGWFNYSVSNKKLDSIETNLKKVNRDQYKKVLDSNLHNYSYGLFIDNSEVEFIKGNIDLNNSIITQKRNIYIDNMSGELYISPSYTPYYICYSVIDAFLSLVIIGFLYFISKKVHLVKFTFYERASLSNKLLLINFIALTCSLGCYQVLDTESAISFNWVNDIHPMHEVYDDYVNNLHNQLSPLTSKNRKQNKKVVSTTLPNDHCIVMLYQNHTHYLSSGKNIVNTALNNYSINDANINNVLNSAYYYQYQNKDILVSIASYPIISWMDKLDFIHVLISFSIYFLFLHSFIRKRVKIINQLQDDVNILQSGNLLHPVQEIGQDELTDLAHQVNQMRIVYYENMIAEQKAVQLNRDLVTTLSHDIRTPLTTLKGYLEIIKLHKSNPDKQSVYIDRCLSKTDELTDLSNRLFEQAVSSSAIESMEINPISISFIYEMIQEQTQYLIQKGFIIHHSLIETQQNIEGNLILLHRIMNNLFSNLIKYASIDSEILICTKIDNNEFKLIFENTISQNPNNYESNNIGLKSIKHSMELQNGSLYVYQHNESFMVVLTFQLSTIPVL